MKTREDLIKRLNNIEDLDLAELDIFLCEAGIDYVKTIGEAATGNQLIEFTKKLPISTLAKLVDRLTQVT